jgi:hypothetical protein
MYEKAVLVVLEYIRSGRNMNDEGDVRTIGDHLTKDFKDMEEFIVATSFSAVCKATERAVRTKKSQFIVSNLSDDHWVLLCLVDDTVLYKDPLGGEIPANLKKEMEMCAKVSTLKFRSHKMSEQMDMKNNANLVVNNLKILVEEYLQNKPYLIARFEYLRFSTEEDIANFRYTIKKDFEAQIVERLDEIKLQENDEITRRIFSKLMEIYSVATAIRGSTDDYQKILNDELEKQEKDPRYRINEGKIKAARDVFLKGAKVQETKSSNGNFGRVEKSLLDLEKEHPKQVEVVINILNKIASLSDSQGNKAIEKTSNLLKIDEGKLKKLFEIFRSENGTISNESVHKNNQVALPNIEDIKKDVKGKIEIDDDPDIKSLEQLLSELVLGKDNIQNQTTNTDDFEFDREPTKEYYKSLYKDQPDILQLKIISIVSWNTTTPSGTTHLT